MLLERLACMNVVIVSACIKFCMHTMQVPSCTYDVSNIMYQNHLYCGSLQQLTSSLENWQFQDFCRKTCIFGMQCVFAITCIFFLQWMFFWHFIHSIIMSEMLTIIDRMQMRIKRRKTKELHCTQHFGNLDQHISWIVAEGVVLILTNKVKNSVHMVLHRFHHTHCSGWSYYIILFKIDKNKIHNVIVISFPTRPLGCIHHFVRYIKLQTDGRGLVGQSFQTEHSPFSNIFPHKTTSSTDHMAAALALDPTEQRLNLLSDRGQLISQRQLTATIISCGDLRAGSRPVSSQDGI